MRGDNSSPVQSVNSGWHLPSQEKKLGFFFPLFPKGAMGKFQDACYAAGVKALHWKA